jgi:hypothetical protein
MYQHLRRQPLQSYTRRSTYLQKSINKCRNTGDGRRGGWHVSSIDGGLPTRRRFFEVPDKLRTSDSWEK